MKKKTGIFMIAALAAVALTACTQSDTESSSAGTGTSASSGSGTIEASATSGIGSVSADANGSLDSAGTDTSSAASDPYIEVTTSDEAVFEGGVSVEEDVTEKETPALAEENLSDQELENLAEESDDATEESWIGTYLNENDETLTISAMDAGTVSFAFTNAGISGTAAVDGTQATYHGDDYHVVVFEYAGTDIKVTVLSEEDYDASSSPINGVFVRQ